MYHNLANLFYKLSESTFYKEMSKFYNYKKYRVKSIRLVVMPLLRTTVSAIFVFATNIENEAIVMLHCILGYRLPIHHAWIARRAHSKRKFNF